VRRSRIGAIAWGVFLFTLTSWPSPPRVPVVSGIPNFDKLVHFALYAVEAWQRSLATLGMTRRAASRAAAIS
jgi:hypothetical protein